MKESYAGHTLLRSLFRERIGGLEDFEAYRLNTVRELPSLFFFKNEDLLREIRKIKFNPDHKIINRILEYAKK